VEPGAAPVRTANLDAINVIQWCLYYPRILNLHELPLKDEDRRALAESLESWQQGDLLAALSKYPAGREPASDAEKIYFCGLLLAIGQVAEAETRLNGLSAAARDDVLLAELAGALHKLINAVQLKPPPEPAMSVSLASSWLAESYQEQAQGKLEGALAAAQKLLNLRLTSPSLWRARPN
jgi:hypothetical protein